MREAHATDSTQPSGSTGSSNWPLPIAGIILFTTIGALGRDTFFGTKLIVGGVSTTVISALISAVAITLLSLIIWGVSKKIEGNTNNFLNFIKNLSISIVASTVINASAVIIGLVTKGTGITLSSVISGLVTEGAGITLSFLQNTPLSAIAATTPLSTFLVGTVVLTIALPPLLLILKALVQCMLKARVWCVAKLKEAVEKLKEAWQANDLATGEIATAPLSSSQANDLETGEPVQLLSLDRTRGMSDSGIIVVSDTQEEANRLQNSL